MGSVMQFWDDIGNITERGAASYFANQERRRLLAQQDEDRARQLAAAKRQDALQNLQFHQQEADAARRSGNFAGAAAMYQQMLADRNAFDGGKRVGTKFIGTYGTKDDPKAIGPFDPKLAKAPQVVDPTKYDPNTYDWKNPANRKMLDAGIGYQAPQPQLTKVGHTVGTYDPESQKFTALYTEDDPLEEYRKESLDLRRQQIADQKEARQQAAADRAESRAERHQARTDNRRRRTTTATIDRNGKPVTVLIDSETGDVIKEIGAKGYAPKASTFNSAQAMSEAELEAAQATGINPKSKFLSKKDAQRFNAKKAEIYAAKKRAASSASSGGSGGQGGGFNAGGFLSRPVK